MITDFTDRRPVLSGVLITMLFTLIPAVFVIAEPLIPWVELNTAAVLIVYAIVLQSVLSLNVERMSLVMLPFAIMLVAVIVCELIFLISVGFNPPGADPDAFMYMFSSVIVMIFGPEMVGVASALIVCSVISIIRELRL